MTNNTELLGLAAMIEALREELLATQAEGKQSALRFQLGTVEVEANVVVTTETEGNAGVKFWVLQAGAGVSHSDARTQRVKITLQPWGDTAISRDATQPPE